MSTEDYSVGIKLSLVENVSRGLVAMAGKFAMLDKQAMVFQARLNALKSQAALGASMVGFGVALATPLVLATNQAGKLQQQLKMVQIATSATEQQMEDFHHTISKVALGSIFNVTDVAKMSKTLATAGNFNIGKVQSLTPQFVEFAQIQKLLKGTDYTKSVEQAIKLAEITGNFDPTAIQTSLNALTKLSFIMPGNVDKVLGAFKYMEGTMKNVMGMNDEQSLMLVAFLQRMGMEGTRAGTQLINFVSRTIPQVFGSGLWEGKSLQNLQTMGMLDVRGVPQIYTNGKIDPLKLFHNLGNFITRDFKTMPEDAARTDIMRRLQQTFGGTGTRLASLLTTPQAIKQFEEIQEAYKRHPNLDILSESMNDLLSKQVPQMFSALKTVFTDLGYALLPDTISVLKVFNAELLKFDSWINTHQKLTRRIEEVILSIAGLSMLGGTLLLIKAGLTGLIIPLQIFTKLLPGLASGLLGINLPTLLIIGAIGALGFGLYELYKHWDVVKAKVQELYAAFQNTAFYKIAASALEKIYRGLSLFAKGIMFVVNTIARAYNAFTNPGSYLNTKTLISGATTGLNYLVNPTAAPSYQGITKTIYQARSKAVAVNANANQAIQPIHVHLNLDGRKVAHVVANHIYNQATGVPNSASQFDTSLSPMPAVANSIGVTR